MIDTICFIFISSLDNTWFVSVIFFTNEKKITMPPRSKRQKQAGPAMKAINDHKSFKHILRERCLTQWEYNLESFDEWDLSNPKGRSRTDHENKLVLLSVKMILKMQIKMAKAKEMDVHTISWTQIEMFIAQNLNLNKNYVRILRKNLLTDGEIATFGSSGNTDSPNNKDDEADYDSECDDDDNNTIESKMMINKQQFQDMVDQVDEQHKLGVTVTRNKLRLFLRDKHNIKPSKSSISRYMKRGGLKYKPTKNKGRNIGAYRKDLLRNYLIKLDKLVKGEDNPACDYVLCFTDESYCHQNHSCKNSISKKGSVINQTSSKGTRIIILHAIDENEPLAQKDENNRPIDSITFAPNNESLPLEYFHPDKLLTAECMWKADIKTGNYHDNMNSEMFLKWVKERLVPTFERNHPNKRMILIMDNAAYHHKREVGNLSSKTKPELRILAEKYNIQHLNVPLTIRRLNVLETDPNVTAYVHGEDCCIMLNGSVDVFDRASATKPMIPTSDELKLAILNYLKEHNKEVLECMVERFLNERGHEVVWTPPYSPDLQPIELFWAAGKNHVALNSKFGITIKEVTKLLREGWYGKTEAENNAELDDEFKKRAVRCDRLFQHTIKMANDKFIPICDGLKGKIGSLWIDPDYVPNYDDLPLDMLIAGLDDTDDDDDDDRYAAVDIASL